MTETLTVYPQILNYYSYNVMCNYAFEEPEQVIQNGYMYEENGVLYCASATQKGVYCYTYARNNPLMYTDPDGEIAWFIPLIAIGVSALVSAASYTISVAASPGGFQNWSWDNFGASMMFGIGSGLITSGIGGVFGAVGSLGPIGELGRAGAHAVSNGMFSYAMDGNFWSGAASGFFSSIVGSATHDLPVWAQMGASTLTGGFTSKASGGTFWQGAANGLMVSGLNHAAHAIVNRPRVYRSPVGNNFGRRNGECALRVLEEFSRSYGRPDFDFDRWYELNGSKLGVPSEKFIELVKSSNVFTSDEMGRSIDNLTNAFSNNQRIMAAFLTESGGGHAVMVNKIKVWPDGTYAMWLAETSQQRIVPRTITSMDGYVFASFYLRIR